MTDIDIKNANGLKRQREDEEMVVKKPRMADEEAQEADELSRVFQEVQAIEQAVKEV
jgi:hypothetical protein